MKYTCFRIFGALGQFGKTGPKYPNGLGYIESNAKSSTAHLAPNDVRSPANFYSSISGDRFNFCYQFFNLGMHIYEKIEKYIHESKFVHQKKLKRLSKF